MLHRTGIGLCFALIALVGGAIHAHGQERVKIAYSSADASNVVWFTALNAGIYRKHG